MIAYSGQPIPIEVTFQPGLLFVAMKVFDVTAGYPGSLISTIPMTEVYNGTYGASFAGAPGKKYTVAKTVYTDGTYTVPDLGFSQGSDAVQCVALQTGAGAVAAEVIGIVAVQEVVAVVEPNEIIAVVED